MSQTVLYRFRIVVRDETVQWRCAAGRHLWARFVVQPHIDDGAELSKQTRQILFGGAVRHIAEEQLLIVVELLLRGLLLLRMRLVGLRLLLRYSGLGPTFLGCDTIIVDILCESVYKQKQTKNTLSATYIEPVAKRPTLWSVDRYCHHRPPVHRLPFADHCAAIRTEHYWLCCRFRRPALVHWPWPPQS